MKRQNKANQNKEKKEQKTKKLVQVSVKGRTITVHIKMEKRTGKVALEMAISPFEKTFILFSYLTATDVQDIWLLGFRSNISEKLFSFL